MSTSARKESSERARERARLWAAANPEKNRARARRHYEDNREKHIAQAARWAAENPEKRREYNRRYSRANPVKAATAAAKRRALKANATQGDPIETAAYEQILRDGICEICGSRGPIEVDHIVPLAKGGAHDWTNMAGLCRTCNRSKGDKSLLMFLLDRLDARPILAMTD